MALPVGLVLLAVTTLLALAGSRMGLLELRIAINDEREVQARQQAQSLVDAVAVELARASAAVAPPVRCLHRDSRITFEGACAGADPLLLPGPGPWPADGEEINALVAALRPATAPPPVGAGFSATRFSASRFGIVAAYDGTGQGHGRARIHEGLAVVRPAPAGVQAFSDPAP